MFVNHEQYLTKFLYGRLADSDLPFSQEELNFMSPKAKRDFCMNQWKFIPVFLRKKDIHREIRREEVLPFLSDTQKNKGSYGTVFRVELCPGCHDLIEGTDEVCGMSKIRTNVGWDAKHKYRSRSLHARNCMKASRAERRE
jgi:hypothetical protein